MTLDELKKLIADDEGETMEVKETTGQSRDACETLCAFLNKNGGPVVFGVTKKGKLTGQLISDKTKRELFEVFAEFGEYRTRRLVLEAFQRAGECGGTVPVGGTGPAGECGATGHPGECGGKGPVVQNSNLKERG